MKQFNVGDKVKRTVCTTGCLRRGDIYTVSKLNNNDWLYLEEKPEGPGPWNPEKFELEETSERAALSDAIDLCVKHKVGVSLVSTVYTDDINETAKERLLDELFPQKSEKDIEIEKLEEQAKQLAINIAKLKEN